jgi:hypothetical protein
MREAMSELTQQEKLRFVEKEKTSLIVEEEEEEMLLDEEEEEEAVEASWEYVVAEKEDEKVYGETLWSQVDSSQSC